MNRFVVALGLVGAAFGAPVHELLAGHAGVYAGHAGVYAGQAVVGAPVASAPAVVGQTHHSYAAGPPTVENRIEYGVVGQRTVQTGHQQVVAGHTFVVAGQEAIPQPAVSYAAGAPQNIVETKPLPAPVIPAPAPYAAAIPPAPVPNVAWNPAETVVQTKIAAPVRTHTKVTPVVTNIVPELNVQKYNVDVPVAVPRAVPREVIVNKHVAAPYEVPVPRAVPVPAPYKVHPVQEIVETPHIHHSTIETHSHQQIVTAHATPVHAVSHVPVAAHAAPVAVAHAAPVAVAHAAPVAVAHAAPVAVAHAAAPFGAIHSGAPAALAFQG